MEREGTKEKNKIKAELIYNPYLLETKISFNGKKPRINSQVERVQGKRLQEWVKRLPGIFRDEMNGYDFELVFSGTRQDYEEVVASFQKAGAGTDRVYVFHKKELNGRLQKCRDIKSLLVWMKNTQNRKFDYNAFRESHTDLFDDSYTLVLIGGVRKDIHLFEEIDVSIESFSSPIEIKEANLTDTPIVFLISETQMKAFQDNLRAVKKKEHFMEEQVFFLPLPGTDAEKVRRVIMDLGIENPQMVTSEHDAQIKRYMELFPITDYTRLQKWLLKRWNCCFRILIFQESCQQPFLVW